MLLATDIIPKDWDLHHDHHTSYDAQIDPTYHKLDHRHIHVNHNDHHHHHGGLQTGTGLEEKTSEHCSNEDHFLKITRKKKKVEVGIRGEHRSSSKVCVDCHTSKTPLWRSGPSGPKSLCNACGIRYRKKRSGFDFVGLPKQARVLQKRFAGKEEAEAAVLLMALSWGASLHS